MKKYCNFEACSTKPCHCAFQLWQGSFVLKQYPLVVILWVIPVIQKFKSIKILFNTHPCNPQYSCHCADLNDNVAVAIAMKKI